MQNYIVGTAEQTKGEINEENIISNNAHAGDSNGWVSQ